MDTTSHNSFVVQNDVTIENITTPTNKLTVTLTFNREDVGNIEGEIDVTGRAVSASEKFQFTDTQQETVTKTFTFDVPEGEEASVTVSGTMTDPESVTDQAVATIPGPGVDDVSIVDVETDINSLTATAQFDASEDVRIGGGISINATHISDEDRIPLTTEKVSLEPPHPSTVEVPFELSLPKGTEVPVEISAFMNRPVARTDGDTAFIQGPSRSPSGVLDRFRQPQYTGENRCIPCTVVNTAIAAGLAVMIGAVTFLYSGSIGGATLAGTVVFLLSAVLIYLRGYLVPGTPQFTKRYFPDRLLQWFDKHPSSAAIGDQIDVETTLNHAGVVTDCENENDLCLTDSFRTAWHDRIRAIRNEEIPRSTLANILNIDPHRISIQDHGDAFEAWSGDRRLGQWESHAAFLADVAAANELGERSPAWDQIEFEHRGRILNGLRIFLEQCPACDGSISIDQSVVQSCCRSVGVTAMTCDDCGARLLEAEQHHESDI